MDDLITWLRQQMDDDEAMILRNRGNNGLTDDAIFPDYRTYSDDDTAAADAYIEHFAPPRMQAEVDAKRRILDAYEQRERESQEAPSQVFGYHATGLLIAIKHLAAAIAERPGYLPEWRP
jgi:hypothetical protein